MFYTIDWYDTRGNLCHSETQGRDIREAEENFRRDFLEEIDEITDIRTGRI